MADLEKLPQKLQFLIIGLDILLIAIGIVLLSLDLSTTNHEIPNAIKVDYTNCFDRNILDNKQTCIQTLSNSNFTKCSCEVAIDLNNTMNGDIILYYELDYDHFNLTKDSRDEQQLNGKLSNKLAPSCAPYDYVNTTEGVKPIAPCGAMADAMFNDSYSLSPAGASDYTPITAQDILEPKDRVFHNPALPEGVTLAQAFQNFTKPINWVKNVWELNGNNTQNNGFEYEPFIAWMNRDWTQKPVWRVDNSTPGYEKGLWAGHHAIIIHYNYPLSRYNGTRSVILGNRRVAVTIPNNTAKVFGGILLAIGLLVLGAASYVMYNKHRKGKDIEQPEPEASPINTTS